MHPDYSDRVHALGMHLNRADWAGHVMPAGDLHLVGQAPHQHLAFAVAMRTSDGLNAYGVPGTSLVAKPASGKPDRLGCGRHGGLGAHEQSPFLMISGPGFAAGGIRGDRSAVIDIAPTVLTHLGLMTEGMDGVALQRPVT